MGLGLSSLLLSKPKPSTYCINSNPPAANDTILVNENVLPRYSRIRKTRSIANAITTSVPTTMWTFATIAPLSQCAPVESRYGDSVASLLPTRGYTTACRSPGFSLGITARFFASLCILGPSRYDARQTLTAGRGPSVRYGD